MEYCIDCGGEMRYVGNGTWECTECDSIYEIEGTGNDNESEALSVYDAARIWASHGKDEDYMFGYTEEELEDAL